MLRLVRIEGADLSLFEFDYDLTWAAFFMSADETIYGRYGGRDATGAEARISLDGFRYAMKAALTAHGNGVQKTATFKRNRPEFIRQYASTKNFKGCIHCHQVKEVQRFEAKKAGTWKRDRLWTYPFPDNLGIVLDINRGDVVREVKPNSPADKAGLKKGDIIRELNGMPVHSFADAQYALHYAPAGGSVKISWSRSGKTRSGDLKLYKGWRKTNITWRPSLLDMLPSLPLFGPDLNAKEKKQLKLDAKRLAFRLEDPLHSQATKAGLRPNDIVIGIDGLKMETDVVGFLGHVRRFYLVGDRVQVDVIRNGKRMKFPMVLR